MIMVEALHHTLSALQAFGLKLGFTGPGDRTPDAGPAEAELDADFEPLDAGPGPGLQAVALPGPPAEAVSPTTTVYGFRANLKPVKAPDEVRGHLLNTLV
jgi:hypothetical protein